MLKQSWLVITSQLCLYDFSVTTVKQIATQSSYCNPTSVLETYCHLDHKSEKMHDHYLL